MGEGTNCPTDVIGVYAQNPSPSGVNERNGDVTPTATTARVCDVAIAAPSHGEVFAVTDTRAKRIAHKYIVFNTLAA